MRRAGCALVLLVLGLTGCAWRTTEVAAPEKVAVTIDWNKIIRVSNTNATLQAVVTPLMKRNTPTHDKVWGALKVLRCDLVRYVPWLPYPKTAVAELDPPGQRANV